MSTAGVVDANFNPSTDSAVYALAIQSDGKIVLGGSFQQVPPRLRSRPTATNVTLNTPYGPSTVPAAGTSASVPIYINHLARVNKDGTLDTTYFPDPSDTVLALALQGDGSIVVAGSFTSFAPYAAPTGTIRNHIGRVASDGTLDPTFNPNANGQVDVVDLAGQRRDDDRGDLYDAPADRLLRLDSGQPSGDPQRRRDGQPVLYRRQGRRRERRDPPTLALEPGGQFLAGGSFRPIDGSPGSNLDAFQCRRGPEPLLQSCCLTDRSNAIGVQANRIRWGGFGAAHDLHALWLRDDRRHPPHLLCQLEPTDSSPSSSTQPNGQILVGGLFSNFAGFDRIREPRAARMSTGRSTRRSIRIPTARLTPSSSSRTARS